MSTKKRSFSRQPSPSLGDLLRKLRKRMPQNEAAKKLGISPEHLCMIEKGRRIASDLILRKAAEIYGIPLEALLIGAYWPQLLFLTAIMEPAGLSTNRLDELKKSLEEDEQEELARYAAFLILKRHIANNSSGI